ATSCGSVCMSWLGMVRYCSIHAIRLLTTELIKLLAKFCDAIVQGTHSGIVFGIDLSKPLELRLRGDHFACDCPRRVQHRFSFLLDVERVVLAGKLRELIGGIVQILLRHLEALFEKHSFAVRGRSRELGNE